MQHSRAYGCVLSLHYLLRTFAAWQIEIFTIDWLIHKFIHIHTHDVADFCEKDMNTYKHTYVHGVYMYVCT